MDAALARDLLPLHWGEKTVTAKMIDTAIPLSLVDPVMNEKLIKANSSCRFISPTLTLSAMALGASAAHGSVVVTDFADVTSTGANHFKDIAFNLTTGVVQAHDVDWGANSDSLLRFGASGNQGKGWTDEEFASGTKTSFTSSPVAPGSTVDSTNSWVRLSYAVSINLTDAYFGVKVTGVDGTHYGWIQFSTGPDAGGTRGPGSITAKAAALETTPNTAVTVVPEPSSALLLGLAAGAGSFRRRRSQAA